MASSYAARFEHDAVARTRGPTRATRRGEPPLQFRVRPHRAEPSNRSRVRPRRRGGGARVLPKARADRASRWRRESPHRGRSMLLDLRRGGVRRGVAVVIDTCETQGNAAETSSSPRAYGRRGRAGSSEVNFMAWMSCAKTTLRAPRFRSLRHAARAQQAPCRGPLPPARILRLDAIRLRSPRRRPRVEEMGSRAWVSGGWTPSLSGVK